MIRGHEAHQTVSTCREYRQHTSWLGFNVHRSEVRAGSTGTRSCNSYTFGIYAKLGKWKLSVSVQRVQSRGECSSAKKRESILDIVNDIVSSY